MRHAIYVPPFGGCGDVDALVALAREAESAGWDGFFVWDHILFEDDVPFADPWIALTAIACATSRITLGPLVTPLPRRRPWKVAREAVTLDHLSKGRLVLGVGLGIDHWREYRAFYEEATDDRQRAGLVDDGIEIITRLWSGDEVSYAGERYSMRDVRFLPVPYQQPRIPIWSAALLPMRGGPTRRAARCDGIMPFRPGGVPSLDDVRSVRDAVARVRTAGTPFDICIGGRRDHAAALEEAGATWMITSFGPENTPADVRAQIDLGPPRT